MTDMASQKNMELRVKTLESTQAEHRVLIDNLSLILTEHKRDQQREILEVTEHLQDALRPLVKRWVKQLMEEEP